MNTHKYYVCVLSAVGFEGRVGDIGLMHTLTELFRYIIIDRTGFIGGNCLRTKDPYNKIYSYYLNSYVPEV